MITQSILLILKFLLCCLPFKLLDKSKDLFIKDLKIFKFREKVLVLEKKVLYKKFIFRFIGHWILSHLILILIIKIDFEKRIDYVNMKKINLVHSIHRRLNPPQESILIQTQRMIRSHKYLKLDFSPKPFIRNKRFILDVHKAASSLIQFCTYLSNQVFQTRLTKIFG